MSTSAALPSWLTATRRGRPGDDPIFALNAEAVARRARGEAVVNATLGALLDEDGRLAVLPCAAEAVRSVPAAEWAAYAPIAGPPAFLEAVKADALRAAPHLAAVCAAVATPGGSGALRHAIATFLDPGQALLTSSFYWGPYETLARECERGLETFPTFGPSGGLGLAALDRALGRRLAADGRALLILNDPCHNPTGYSMSEAEWDAVARVLDGHAASGPLAVVVDAAYCEYGPGDGLARPLRALEPLLGRVLVLIAWSASKTFTHYGLRVGALLALVPDAGERRAIQDSLTFACRGTWSNCNRGGMHAVTRLLTEPALAERARAERGAFVALLRARVEAFNEAARAHGVAAPRYEGGFFVTVPTDRAAERARRLCDAGLFVVPLDGGLRLGLCAVARADVERLVAGVAHALK